MLLTLFYMIATWVQSWRLSSLRTSLQSIFQASEKTRPTLMLYAATQLSVKDETNKCKFQNGNNVIKDILSSHLCSNRNLAKLGNLLWYQGDKRLCTIYPQQEVDVSDWLLYPYGKTVFPLFTHNSAHTTLHQNTKMHVLIEADLTNYVPLASSKATKLEDYGLIITWTSDDIFGVILETDLDHITKFSITMMQGQCFINNGLPVTRIESVSVSGKPCICNYEQFDLVESRKLTSSSQWNTYVKKLSLVSNAAKAVYQQNKPVEVKEIPGLVVSPGTMPITLQLPTILEITLPSNTPEGSCGVYASVPSTPPPTPSSINAIIDRNSLNLNSLTNLSLGSFSNLSLARSQELILEEGSQENLNKHTPLKSFKNKNKDTRISSSMASSRSSLSSDIVNNSPSIKTEFGSNATKPPNILIYADSAVAIDNVRNVLETTLKEDKYTIYSLSTQEACSDLWMDQAKLVIVCGNVGSDVASQFVEYIVHGGKLLALCSDILKTLLPTFKTAEVRENELVRFSYGKWKHVRMMHHVFCYQASPVKTKFPQDVDDSKTATPPTPVSASVCDRFGKSHTFNVKVLGSEETWHTPSILLANLTETNGKAVFSQIHLEADPTQYEFEESKYTALKQSNVTRLEIFSDLLSTHLGVEVTTKPIAPPTYSSGFFLGRHELKLEMLKKLKDKMQSEDILKTSKLEIQFCSTSVKTKPATSSFLPVMVHRCPDNFNTVEYFENLNTEAFGRLVIYTDVITSTNNVVENVNLQHGLAVITQYQTQGLGRGKNRWLSPKGCAMFSLQIHVPLKSVVGERISLIQHMTAVAIVSTVRSIPGYEDIDLTIKWPNDIYVGNTTKVGGLMIRSSIQNAISICNIGVGINLSNTSPTVCINELIKNYNKISGTKLKPLTSERFLALIFNELENLINTVQKGNLDHLYELYYKYWLHTDADVTVILPDGSSQEVKVLGIDEYGFLKVKGNRGKIFSVQPDGNSFDILKGLIAPKT